MLLCGLLAIQRAFSVESSDGGRDALRLSGLDPAGIFLGKAAAIAVQLIVLEIVLAIGVVVLYGREVSGFVLLAVTCLAATAGLAAAGTLYGVLAAGLRVRETLLPILLLPGRSRRCSSRPPRPSTRRWGTPRPTAGPGAALLAFFAGLYLVVGALAFGPLLEES